MNKILYCPVNPVMRQFGLYVTGAGKETTRPGESYPHEYHSSSCYFTWKNGRILSDCQLIYIRDGQGVIEIKRNERIPLRSGTAILLRPEQWHRYRPDAETGWSEAYVALRGEFVSAVIDGPLFKSVPTTIQIGQDGRFEHDLLALVDDILSNSAEHPYSLALRALTLLVQLAERQTKNLSASISDMTIRQANLHIARHLHEVVDYQALAKRLGMSYTVFRGRFREYNAMAPLEYQISLRMQRAAQLLRDTDMPVTQIAKVTGFATLSYFSRLFRAKMGVSPMQFRRGGNT